MFKVLNRNLRYLFILNTAFGFSVQLVTPLFPLFLSGLGAVPSENAWVISLGGLVATSLMLPAGLFMDRIGKRTLLLSSLVVNTVIMFMMSNAGTWQQVLPLFIVYSASGALFMPARMAMITDNSNPDTRASVFGIMNTSWPLAGVVSTLISGYLIQTSGWRYVFLVGSAINAITIIPSLRLEKQEPMRDSTGGGFRELFSGETAPVLLTFFIYGILMTTAMGGINLIIPLYLVSRFSLNASQVALFFTAQNMLSLVTQIPSGKVAERFGMKRTVLTLIALIPFLYASWHFIGDWKVMLVLNTIAFGLWSMTWPATLTLLSKSVPEEMVGAAFGVNITGNRLGFTLGPLIASYFYSNYSQTSPFLVSGAICLAAVLFAFRLKDSVKEPKA
ncbi:MFS transporter [Candidatus Bathyarchaeota archaeon]|nr:MFS transporter [Candidatus Bathyarchaeota archaeon]